MTFNGNNAVGNGFASNTNDGTVYGHAAATGAIAVGAASYAQTPGFGFNPPQIESFSSAGPTRIFFDTHGNPVSMVRQTPVITAPDGGNTSFFGFDDGDADALPNFYGTSAAAPAAAGVAALMLQANPSLTPAAVRSLLINSAIDMDNPATVGFDFGSDVGSGAGLIQADRAVQGALGGTGTISINDVSVTEGNGLTTATFPGTRTGGTAAFSVNYATSNGSATAGDGDYFPDLGTLQFGVGVNSQTIGIFIVGDSKREADENFFITLSGATNGAVIGDNVGVGTIVNDDPNNAPVVTIPSANVAASAGQVFAASNLFWVTDIDNDVLTYFLYDGTAGGGHWVVNGAQVPDQTVVALGVNEVAHATFVAGPAGSSDDLRVLAYDGQAYSGNTFSHFNVNVAGVVNHPPVVTVPSANVAASAGQSIAASSLFSVSDADHDVLTYFLYDGTANGGHFVVNGAQVPDQTVVALSVNEAAHATFVAGPAGSNDALAVLVYDGQAYSGNTFSHFNVNVAGNHAPVVTIPSANVAASPGQSIAASSLFSVSDADNDVLTYFLYDGTTNGGHWVVNGAPVADHTVVALGVNEVAHATFVAGPAGSNDDLAVLAYDGHDYSGNTSFSHFHIIA